MEKKLMEKGFYRGIYGKYDMRKPYYFESGEFFGGIENIADTEKCYTSPDISQVLKWLREEKGVHIDIEVAAAGWYYTIYKFTEVKGLDEPFYEVERVTESCQDFLGYEQAAIGGIYMVLFKYL